MGTKQSINTTMITINQKDDPRYFYSKKYDVWYLRIPKCASTTICAWLEIDDQEFSYDPPPYPAPVITCIRHPIDRFVSGYHEALRRNTVYGNFKDFVTQCSITGTPDNHLIPMTHYLKHNVNRYFFVADYDLTSQFCRYFKSGFPHHMYNPTLRNSVQPSHLIAALDDIINLYMDDVKLFIKVRKDHALKHHYLRIKKAAGKP